MKKIFLAAVLVAAAASASAQVCSTDFDETLDYYEQMRSVNENVAKETIHYNIENTINYIKNGQNRGRKNAYLFNPAVQQALRVLKNDASYEEMKNVMILLEKYYPEEVKMALTTGNASGNF